jgi:hypothetical protein
MGQRCPHRRHCGCAITDGGSTSRFTAWAATDMPGTTGIVTTARNTVVKTVFRGVASTVDGGTFDAVPERWTVCRTDDARGVSAPSVQRLDL